MCISRCAHVCRARGTTARTPRVLSGLHGPYSDDDHKSSLLQTRDVYYATIAVIRTKTYAQKQLSLVFVI